MKTEEFISYLRTQKNPEKAPGMENYMRNRFNFLGLQAAERRKLAKPYLRVLLLETKERHAEKIGNESVVDWEALDRLWQAEEREFQLIGVDYLKHVSDFLTVNDLKKIKRLIVTKSWWDTVDFLAKNVGTIVQKEKSLETEMLRWSMDENLWVRRSAILHQLHFKEETHTELLNKIIQNNLEDDDFFIRKAIGWALREYAKTDEEWVIQFVENYSEQLSPLSQREALKNIHS